MKKVVSLFDKEKWIDLNYNELIIFKTNLYKTVDYQSVSSFT